jgi:hypothetical protein
MTESDVIATLRYVRELWDDLDLTEAQLTVWRRTLSQLDKGLMRQAIDICYPQSPKRLRLDVLLRHYESLRRDVRAAELQCAASDQRQKLEEQAKRVDAEDARITGELQSLHPDDLDRSVAKAEIQLGELNGLDPAYWSRIGRFAVWHYHLKSQEDARVRAAVQPLE